MAGGKASEQKIKLGERRQKALSLRKSGASYRAIASAISQEKDQGGNLLWPKYSEAHAHQDVSAVLRDLNTLTRLDAEEYRALEMERLDGLQLAIARQAQAGDLNAVYAALAISQRRCKLLGLDAPIQIQVQKQLERELEGFLDQLEIALSPDTYAEVLKVVADSTARSEAAGSN